MKFKPSSLAKSFAQTNVLCIKFNRIRAILWILHQVSLIINYEETIKIQLYGRKDLKNCTERLSGNNLKSANAYAKQFWTQAIHSQWICWIIFFSRTHVMYTHTQTNSLFHFLSLVRRLVPDSRLRADEHERIHFSRADWPLLKHARISNSHEQNCRQPTTRLHFVLFCSSFRLIKSIWKWLHMHTK